MVVMAAAVIRAGRVPSPNAIITNMPFVACAVEAANSSALYTRPQGNQPQNSPRMAARLRLVAGINRCACGAIRLQIPAPAVSTIRSKRQLKATCNPISMISKPLARRTGPAMAGITPAKPAPIAATNRPRNA